MHYYSKVKQAHQAKLSWQDLSPPRHAARELQHRQAADALLEIPQHSTHLLNKLDALQVLLPQAVRLSEEEEPLRLLHQLGIDVVDHLLLQRSRKEFDSESWQIHPPMHVRQAHPLEENGQRQECCDPKTFSL